MTEFRSLFSPIGRLTEEGIEAYAFCQEACAEILKIMATSYPNSNPREYMCILGMSYPIEGTRMIALKSFEDARQKRKEERFDARQETRTHESETQSSGQAKTRTPK